MLYQMEPGPNQLETMTNVTEVAHEQESWPNTEFQYDHGLSFEQFWDDHVQHEPTYQSAEEYVQGQQRQIQRSKDLSRRLALLNSWKAKDQEKYKYICVSSDGESFECEICCDKNGNKNYKSQTFKKGDIDKHIANVKHRKSIGADVSQQPNFSHLQYGQHAIHSSYAENPPFYDPTFGIPHTQQQNTDYDLEAALAASMEGRNLGGINIREPGSTQLGTMTHDTEVAQGQESGYNPGGRSLQGSGSRPGGRSRKDKGKGKM
uniref:Uncharacterized protein n=1 Tax=Meloidogyne incognita TaxID=6306 RepID=A0A914KT45_MELIC